MLLLTPGPTPVPDRVRQALAAPIVHHRTEEFAAVWRSCGDGLARVFQTAGPVAMLTGTGTTAVEAAQLSFLRPGDTVIVCENGKFGRRWCEVYARTGALYDVGVVTISAPMGRAIAPDQLSEALGAHPETRAVVMAHCETSSATVNDVRTLAQITRMQASDAIVIVDGVSSIGAIPFEMDAWGIDVACSASQKALMCPPGVGLVAMGARAVARLKEATGVSLAPLSLDLRRWLTEEEGAGLSPQTPAIGLVFGLVEALAMIEAEGLEEVWARTAGLAEASRRALTEMGLELASEAPSDSVTAVRYPDGVDDGLRQACAREHRVLFAGGQDEWKGRVLRISHMGAVTAADTIAGIDAIAVELERCGLSDGQPGAGRRLIREMLRKGSGNAAGR